MTLAIAAYTCIVHLHRFPADPSVRFDSGWSRPLGSANTSRKKVTDVH